MFSKQQVLRAHYHKLGQKFAAYGGLLTLILTVFAPFPANAGQLSARKAVLSDSAGGATSVAIDHFFTNNTTNTIKAVRFQFCTSPLYNTTCTLPTGLVRGTTITTQLNNGGAMTNAFTAATSGTTDVLLTNATGNTFTATQVVNIKLSGFTNPTAVNSEFYIRIITCDTTTCTMGGADNKDNGGIAVSTSQIMSVTANVQEDITFCVGVTIAGNCGTATGTSVTLAPNPMGATTVSKGTAQIAASTNATSGYVITYNATTFTDTTADTIAAAATGGVALNAGGTEQFGFNLIANSGGNFGTTGAAPSGGTGTATAPYATNNSIAYNTAGAIQIASAAGATAQTTYTVSYGANVSNTTKPGVYTATQTFIATGTY
jgi:hypothetical protein